MGLVTLALITTFSLLYLSKSLGKKPAVITRVVDLISNNLDKVALWGAAYAFIAAVLTLVMVYNAGDMLLRLVANLMIVVMALPIVFERMLPKFQEKLNPVIVEESKNLIGWVTKQEKYVGYAGAALSLLLFAVLFR
jgi:hypothetical protein